MTRSKQVAVRLKGDDVRIVRALMETGEFKSYSHLIRFALKKFYDKLTAPPLGFVRLDEVGKGQECLGCGRRSTGQQETYYIAVMQSGKFKGPYCEYCARPEGSGHEDSITSR